MPGPLEGLKVLDFSTRLPGPFGTMLLGDMGADVIRVVQPGADGVRPDDEGGQPNAVDLTLNRNKRSIAVNLKAPASREIIRRLVDRVDVLVEQFRPGVMERLGWDYPAARAVNEKIVYCSLTGYGQNGPMRDRAGHDINYLSMSGIMSYTGDPRTGPTACGIQIADLTAGSYNLVVGVLAALHHLHRTGEGQYVDVAMLDGSIALNVLAGAELLRNDHVARRETELLNGGSLYGFYRTRDGEYLSAGGLEAKFLLDFLKALGREDLAEPGDTMHSMKNKAEARAAVAEVVAQKTLDEWREIFARYDACVEPVLDIKAMSEHPQTRERKMIVEVSDNRGGHVRQIACPIRFSITQPQYRHAGRPGGAETGDILREIGFSQDEIGALSDEKAVGDSTVQE